MGTLPVTAQQGARTRVAASFWVGCLQYFVLEAVTATHYSGHYSYRRNYMSDLGAIHCLASCSPWHAIINTSFVLQGICISLGAVLLPRRYTPGIAGMLARVFLLIAALGVVMVGFTPEDVNTRIHIRGALLNFVGGSVGLLLLGAAFARLRGLRDWLSLLTLAAGAISFAADTLFVFPSARLNSTWGVGLLERIAGYPLPLLLACAGLTLLRQHVRPRLLHEASSR